MKKKILYALPLLSFLLTGCFLLPKHKKSETSSEQETSSYSSENYSEQSSTYSSENYSSENSSSSSSTSQHTSSDSSQDKSSYEDESSYEEESSDYSEEPSYSEDSSDNSSDDTSLSRYAEIEIYATNDIHGEVEKFGTIASYLNNRKDGNTLLIDQGDTWQGSIYSNYNHGALLTDIMNYVQYDARSIGNHDFDWGTSYITSNKNREYAGYSTPVLAGNVFDYDQYTKTLGTTQQSDLGTTSVTYTLENNLKVGILGGIGEDQLTSITSSYTTNIGFGNHIDFIKNEATHLRNDEHCDIVICSIHTGQDDVMGNNLSDYVDLVLCGHTHQREIGNEGSLYCIQSQGYGQNIGHVKLTYDRETGAVSTNAEHIYYSTIESQTTLDSTISGLIETYKEECDSEANETLASNVSGYFSSYGIAEHVMTTAILEEAQKVDSTVQLAYINQARRALPNYEWNYADLYESFPFDNNIYIVEITGTEFMNEIVGYNYICKSSSFTDTVIYPDNTYKVAVIDYLLFHINSSRDYDYFPVSGGTYQAVLSKNYREILRDWLRTHGYNTGTQIKSSDYSASEDNYQFYKGDYVLA